MVQNFEVVHSAILSPCLWPCGSRVLMVGSQHQMTDVWIPLLRRRGQSPSYTHSLEEAGGRWNPWRESAPPRPLSPAKGPELLEAAGSLLLLQVKSAGPWEGGRMDTWKRKQSLPWQVPASISGRGVCTRSDSGLPWVMESHYSFLSSNRIKSKINTCL